MFDWFALNGRCRGSDCALFQLSRGKGCPLEVFTAVLSQKESQVYDKGQDKIVEISTAPVVYVCYRALMSATDD
jgi:hypothetical protein